MDKLYFLVLESLYKDAAFSGDFGLSWECAQGVTDRYFVSSYLDILFSYLALWSCRIVRFLFESSQKSGCSCGLRLQFLRCGVLFSEDLFHTMELQDLPPKLRNK